MTRLITLTSVLAVAVLAAACNPNKHPEMTTVGSAMQDRMASQPVAASNLPPLPESRAPGSLWASGNSTFFKDNRARKVGDIVTVLVDERSTGEVEANTEASRVNKNRSGITNLLNLNNLLVRNNLVPGANTLLNTDSNRDFEGEGKTDREDKLVARIAAVVTQVLPNGYLVIEGSREMMLNYEKQKMLISGVIRPDDITPDNTIASEKIAEARIAYAGQGIIDDTQRPQYGDRFLDKWLPF